MILSTSKSNIQHRFDHNMIMRKIELYSYFKLTKDPPPTTPAPISHPCVLWFLSAIWWVMEGDGPFSRGCLLIWETHSIEMRYGRKIQAIFNSTQMNGYRDQQDTHTNFNQFQIVCNLYMRKYIQSIWNMENSDKTNNVCIPIMIGTKMLCNTLLYFSGTN